MTNKLTETYGESIDLGFCILGRNLNTWTMRGYHSLKVLADISGGDVYDQFKNPGGTQRDLKVKHSKQALQYALESLDLTVEENPRAFPEITLNVRDTSVIQIFDLAGNEITINTLADLEQAGIYRVIVKTEEMISPVPEFAPQISRVDGNHRLSEVSSADLDSDMEMPSIPFSFFLGLDTSQERKIFTDINGKHEGMPPAIITTFGLDSMQDEIAVVKSPAAWLARQLSNEGMVFYGKVHHGGSAQGARDKFGAKGPITIQGLKSAVSATLDASPTLKAHFLPPIDLSDPINATEQKKRERVEKAQSLLKVLNRYWTAVRDSNPEAWEDKKDYILLGSTGLNSFSYLAGPVIENLLMKNQADYQHFKSATDYIADRVSLGRENYKGIAGAGGAKHVRDILMGIWAQSDIQTAIAAASLINSSESPLD